MPMGKMSGDYIWNIMIILSWRVLITEFVYSLEFLAKVATMPKCTLPATNYCIVLVKHLLAYLPVFLSLPMKLCFTVPSDMVPAITCRDCTLWLVLCRTCTVASFRQNSNVIFRGQEYHTRCLADRWTIGRFWNDVQRTAHMVYIQQTREYPKRS